MSETTTGVQTEQEQEPPVLMPPQLVQEVLRPPPHSLKEAVAELIFLKDGQLVFCSRENGVHTAKFLNPEDVKRAFLPIVSDSGWLPPDLVRWGHGNGKEWAVLFKPAQIYQLTLSAPQQGQTVIRVPLPSVVILVFDHSLYVWAVKTPVFQPGAPVFCMPLPNVAQSGLVCFGANKHPPASLQTANSVWDTWISGAFTGESCGHKSKLYTNDIREQLRALQGQTKYPKRDLVEHNSYQHKTVEALINHHLKES